MFRLAHFSDPHIGPLPAASLRQLAGKRALGWLNWQRGRRTTHRMDILATLLADLHAQTPDHIALTGDVVNLGLPGEYALARSFVEDVGAADYVSFVPGNHDAYTRDGALKLLSTYDPWMRGDDCLNIGPDELTRFPYVRKRGRVALVGLSSAIPTAPLMATGKLGVLQVGRLNEILADLGREGYCRVVMLHHPVRKQDAGPTAMLTDSHRLVKALRTHGAELVLHGHIHSGLVHKVSGRHGEIPVLCTPSASAAPGRARWPASYNLISIREKAGTWSIHVDVRGFAKDGAEVTLLRSMTF